jgi:type VI secretion system protein ImpK
VAETAVRNNEVVFQPRPETLAFVFQEVLTAIMRLRMNRQTVSDSGLFRAQVKEAINLADKDAQKLGYAPDTVRLAVFAVVAFLDESVLNQQVPVFADWARKPLQEELFGVHVAGEIFFENLRRLLEKADSTEVADALEVYQLCLLLGYRGRYGTASKADLRAIIDSIDAKRRRIRSDSKDLSPSWAPPGNEKFALQPDPWGRRLLYVFVGCLSLALLLFIAFRVSLSSGISALGTDVSETRK